MFNVSQLEAKYSDGDTVNRASLVQKGLLKKSRVSIKILGDGELTKKLSVDVDKVSASAKEKIEKCGGTVNIQVKQPTTENK